MTTSRLAIFLAVLLGGMSTIFLLPKQLGFQPVGVEMQLPKMIGGWYGKEIDVSEKERQVLGKGTDFVRKIYHNGRGYEITASVVLSGEDMNTSIHRPERCLPAQGYSVIASRPVPIPLSERQPMQVTRLLNARTEVTSDQGPNAQYDLTYYWFVGNNDVTSSHFERTWFDIRDRLVHGYNQRWAYITVAAALPPGSEKDPRVEQMVDGWIQDFIKQLVPKIQKNAAPAPAA